MTSTPAKKRREIRQARAAPIVDAFFAWCDQEAGRVLDESPIAQGIGYARNQRVALRRFLDDGRLPMHNNISELNLRRRGRRAKKLALRRQRRRRRGQRDLRLAPRELQLHKIEPFAYMRDLLCLLPRWPRHRVLELAPAYWRETLEKRETQQALDANVLRRVVLGLPGGASHRPPELPRQAATVCDV